MKKEIQNHFAIVKIITFLCCLPFQRQQQKAHKVYVNNFVLMVVHKHACVHKIVLFLCFKLLQRLVLPFLTQDQQYKTFIVSKQPKFIHVLCTSFYFGVWGRVGREKKHSFALGEVLQLWLLLPEQSVGVMHMCQCWIAGFSKSSFQLNKIVTFKKSVLGYMFRKLKILAIK